MPIEFAFNESDGPIPVDHGLYYVDRSSSSPVCYRLDREGQMARPERDVALALLRYAVEMLEQGA